MSSSGFYILLITLFLVSCSSMSTGPAKPDQAGELIDLTHVFSEETIYWPTGKHFELEENYHGMTEKGYFYSSNSYSAAEHGGTHIDAPVHFSKGKQTVDQIPVEKLMGNVFVIDVSGSALNNPDYQISADDIMQWEEDNGIITDGAMLFFKTGFGRYWPDKSRYLGTDQTGPEAVEKLHFPGLGADAAQWIVDNRNIAAVGIDTASIDYGQSTHFEAHRILAKKNIVVIENVANLHMLPATGAYVIALPMNIKGGSGAPVRIIAQLP